VTLSAGGARVEIAPALGGKITRLVLAGRDWLWTNDQLARVAPAAAVAADDGASYVATADTGGYDECLPTVAACTIDAAGRGPVALPDHGELWSQDAPTERIPADDGAAGRGDALDRARLPYAFSRTITVDAAGRRAHGLRARVARRRAAAVPLVRPPAAPVHPGHAARPPRRRARARLVAAQPRAGRRGRGAPVAGAPRGRARATPFGPREVDFTRPALAPRRFGDGGRADYTCKLFLDLPRAAAGRRVRLGVEQQGARLEVEVDSAEVPHLGLWLNHGGGAGVPGARPYFTLGFEPCIGAPDALDAAGRGTPRSGSRRARRGAGRSSGAGAPRRSRSAAPVQPDALREKAGRGAAPRAGAPVSTRGARRPARVAPAPTRWPGACISATGGRAPAGGPPAEHGPHRRTVSRNMTDAPSAPALPGAHGGARPAGSARAPRPAPDACSRAPSCSASSRPRTRPPPAPSARTSRRRAWRWRARPCRPPRRSRTRRGRGRAHRHRARPAPRARRGGGDRARRARPGRRGRGRGGRRRGRGAGDRPAVAGPVALVFAFASPGNRAAAGSLERFAAMVRDDAYRPLLHHRRAARGLLRVDGDRATQRVVVTTVRGERVAYTFVLARQQAGAQRGCWLTESVTREAPSRLASPYSA
jgi:hypothetical protein